ESGSQVDGAAGNSASGNALDQKNEDQNNDDGGLELAPAVTVGGTPVNAQAMGVIGRPAHGIFFTSPATDGFPGMATEESLITLAPLEGGLSDELLDFVS